VTASSANDAWVSQPAGKARHFDGRDWSPAGNVVVNYTMGGFHAMQSLPGTTLAITFDGFFYRYRGQVYARFDTGSASLLRASASAAPGVTVAIDSKSDAYHFDGATWTQVTIDSSVPQRSNQAIWAASATDIWVGGTDGRLFRYDGNTWNDTLWGNTYSVRAIVGFASNDVWFLGSSAYHYNGSTYDLSPFSFPSSLDAGGGSSSSDVWAIASTSATTTNVHHWDGIAWNTTVLNDALSAITSFSATNAYATGTNRIWHWDGVAWTYEVFPVLESFIGMSATGPGDIFAVTPGQILHFDGERWSFLKAPDDIGVADHKIKYVDAHRGYIDILYQLNVGTVPMRRLIRTRPWICEDAETSCADGVDDDCDDAVDDLDMDCP
jgi:hypothetical protein